MTPTRSKSRARYDKSRAIVGAAFSEKDFGVKITKGRSMSETDSETKSETEPEKIPVDDTAALEAAGKVVAARFGRMPNLAVTEILREEGRNRVLRCAVHDAPDGAPASVIVKRVQGEGDHAYDPANDAPDGTAWRFYNEWAGNRFLDSLNLNPPLSAGFIGGDRTAGLIVLQDLGKEGVSLADHMTANDRPALLAALHSYAASMGRLHAATVGKEADFMQIRREIGGTETVREKAGTKWLRESDAEFREICASVNEPLPAGFDADMERVRQAMDEPGPFFAFSPGDTCPDNHRLTETPYARFFDFEFAGFAPTMLTAAYFYLPLPTCWCVNRLPGEAVAQMETIYRTEFAQQCPEAADDSLFYPALLAARAYWTIATICWDKGGILGEDWTWGISTVRQRHLLRLDNFADAAEHFGEYPTFGDLSRRLAANLRTRWNLPEEMPLYPAFREG